MRAPVEVYGSYIPEDVFRIIFSLLSRGNLLDMRTISKAWSHMVWNHLFSISSENYQTSHIIQWLGYSDQDFRKVWSQDNLDSRSNLSLVPANGSSFSQFFNTLLMLRVENKKLFVSDSQLRFLLKEIKELSKPLSFGLLKGLGWSLSKRNRMSVESRLQALVDNHFDKLIKEIENFNAKSMQILIFIRKNLSIEQINRIVNELTELKTASGFVYDEQHLSWLVHELPTENIVFLVKKVQIFLKENNENYQINLLNFLKFAAARADEQVLLSVFDYMQICFKDFDLSTDISLPVRRAILLTLDAFIPVMQGENLKNLLKCIKDLYWYESDTTLHKEAVKIYLINNPEYDYDEIMDFQSLFLDDVDYFQCLFQRLKGGEREKYIDDHLGEFLIDIQISEFSSEKMNFIQKNINLLNARHLEKILSFVRTGLDNSNQKQKASAMYLLEIVSPLIKEREGHQEWIDTINRLIEANDPELQCSLLDLLQKALPSFMYDEPIGLYYDYIYSILKKNDPFTQKKAISSLSLFENRLNPVLKKELLNTLQNSIAGNFEQGLSTLALYLDKSNQEENTETIRKLCTQFNPEYQLKLLEKMLPYFDQNMKDFFYGFLGKELHKNSLYSLEIFFRLFEGRLLGQYCNKQLIESVMANLDHFLLSRNESHRFFVMKKILLILHGNFPQEIQNVCARNFFGGICKNLESLVVSLASQYWLQVHFKDENNFIFFQTWNEHYLNLKKKPELRLTRSVFFHSENPAMELRREACNLVYEILMELKEKPSNQREFLDKLVKELPIFSGLREKFEKTRCYIENIDIEYFEEIKLEAADEGFIELSFEEITYKIVDDDFVMLTCQSMVS